MLNRIIEGCIDNKFMTILLTSLVIGAGIYAMYKTLHDAFGTAEWSGSIHHVMKDLLAIRERQR